MIEFIRLNLGVEDSSVTTALISLSDSQIELYLNIVASRDFPHLLPLVDIPSDSVYAISLLTKIEIYYFLATSVAPEHQLKTDGGGTLSKEQKFKHYSQLITLAQNDYANFIANGGAGGSGNTLTAYNVTLPSRYYTEYNYFNAVKPSVSINLDLISDTFTELTWTYSCPQFYKSRIYIGTDLTYDPYVDSVIPEDYLIKEYTDPFAKKLRLENMTPNTQYTIVIEVIDLTTRKGIATKTFTTVEDCGVDIIGI